MIQLAPTNFMEVQRFFLDFQKKSKWFELPGDQCEYIGIYEANILIGYFATLGYTDNSIDIVQGYLTKEARHKRYPKQAMLLLEAIMKRQGFAKVRLMTHNRFKGYLQFAGGLGYKPTVLLFEKDLN